MVNTLKTRHTSNCVGHTVPTLHVELFSVWFPHIDKMQHSLPLKLFTLQRLNAFNGRKHPNSTAETRCDHADAGPPHPGHHSVQDERLDRRHLALWVVDGDEDVLSVGILFALIIVLQSVLVDHGAGRVGQGASIWQGSILEHRESGY